MVVVSGSWVKNVAAYPVSTFGDMVISNEGKMTAKAVLICRPNSHPFQERTLTLDQPVKVGRSVARTRATATNAIFDCKVLSRHHALLWYENGKFYLQDTKSSNGTFVNNNRLSEENEHHEVSSGDIVQFGVDVVENNRKVTHGCIIATLKLYLSDGKEAKASPSIVEGIRHGFVPLDELYKLHQIIQEATQREQCLETKLIALQTVVDDARKSADESWQAYVGEERLLSRVSALENQLQQAGKNWGEDKYKEELLKLQEDNAAYHAAAKEALEKLHAERLEALATATERERSRISTKQELIMANEQLAQVQQELEDVAQKLNEDQKKSEEKRVQLEQQQRLLQQRLNTEIEKGNDLLLELQELKTNAPNIDKRIIINDDIKTKEDLIAENECETESNKTNGVEPQQNHINLTVAPVSEKDNEPTEKSIIDDGDSIVDNCETTIAEAENVKDHERRLTFNLAEGTCHNGPESPANNNSDENEKDDFDSDQLDWRYLKYTYKSNQKELKKKIEILESLSSGNQLRIVELEQCLNNEKQVSSKRLEENELLHDEFVVLQQKWKECCNENQQLKDKVDMLNSNLEAIHIKDQNVNNSIISNAVNYEQFVSLEEELVLLKEKYSQVNDDKLKLQHDLASLKEQYNKVCNNSYNTIYFYMAPLILMILYLVISAMIS